MDKLELKKALQDRLPDGTVLEDGLLDKIAGGLARTLAPANLASGAKSLAGGAKNLAGEIKGGLVKKFPLADSLALPEKFASLEDMEIWFADRFKAKEGTEPLSGPASDRSPEKHVRMKRPERPVPEQKMNT